MDLRQIDVQLRCVFADSTSGYYYWTNTFFYDLDNPPVSNNSPYWLFVAANEGYLPMVEVDGGRVTAPPGSGILIADLVGFDAPSHAPFDSPAPIFNIARMHFYADGVYVGYKLWRMPVPPSEMADGLISSGVKSYLEGTIGAYLLLAHICTRDGLPIDEIRVSPRVHQWGIRHGTKRRSRPVLIWP